MTMRSLEDFVKEHGLQLERSSPITARSYVTVPGIECERIDMYHWPKRSNGSRYDRIVYVTVFHDGSFGAAIGLSSVTMSLPDKNALNTLDLPPMAMETKRKVKP